MPGVLCGMAGIPDPSTNTTSDKKRYCQYGPNEHLARKQKKERLWGEALLGLIIGKRTYRYVDLYERILQRPLVTAEKKKAHAINNNGLEKASDSQTVSYRKKINANSPVLYNQQIATPASAPPMSHSFCMISKTN